MPMPPGSKLRPHIKTHKLPFFARRQVEAGAVGITCQKIGEAEVMADAGLADIFLPYNILGRPKLERLATLHRRATLSVSADNATTVAGLAETFADTGHRLPVLVECDTGMGRCGVQDEAEAVALARRIARGAGPLLRRADDLSAGRPRGRGESPPRRDARCARRRRAFLRPDLQRRHARPVAGRRGHAGHRVPARHLHLPRPRPAGARRRDAGRLRADGAFHRGQSADRRRGRSSTRAPRRCPAIPAASPTSARWSASRAPG